MTRDTKRRQDKPAVDAFGKFALAKVKLLSVLGRFDISTLHFDDVRRGEGGRVCARALVCVYVSARGHNRIVAITTQMMIIIQTNQFKLLLKRNRGE